MSTQPKILRPLVLACGVLLVLVGCEDGADLAPTGPAGPSARASSIAAAEENRREVDEVDRADGTDASLEGIAGRLRSVDRVLGVLGKRLNAIDASVPPDPIVPPEPILPELEAVLAQIDMRAGYVRDLAAFLEAAVCDAQADRPASLAAADGTVAEGDRTDSDDTSLSGLLGRLGSVENVLGAIGKRLDDIDAALFPPEPVVPPEPVLPDPCVAEVLEPLAAIQAEALRLLEVAKAIGERLIPPRE